MAGKQLHPYRKPYKEIAKELDREDIAPILEMANLCIKNQGGRPRTYQCDEMGLQAFKANVMDYFLSLEEINSKRDERHQLIPDVEGLALYLGIDRTTLNKYVYRGEKWKVMIDYFKNVIAFCKKQLILQGRIPPMIGVFDLANNHDYVNTSEFKLTVNNEKQEKVDDIESKIAESGLVWDSVTHEFIPMERIEEDVD